MESGTTSTTFKDGAGREWDLKLNLGVANRLASEGVIDWLNFFGGKNAGANWSKLLSDPLAVGNLVWATIKPQADKESVTIEQFFEALDGDAIESMIGALHGSIEAFFPKLKSLLVASRAKGEAISKATEAKAVTALDKIDPEKIAATAAAKIETTIEAGVTKMMTTLSDGPSASPSGAASSE